MSALDDFKKFVADAESGSQYAQWAKQNPGELSRWKTFRDLVLSGQFPAAPTMTTDHGKELVDAAVETEHFEQLEQAQPIPPPTPPPPLPLSGSGAGRRMLGGGYQPVTGFQVVTVDRNALTAPKDLPNTSVQFYRSMVSCNVGYDTSIPHDQAVSNNWLLKDSSGNLLINKNYPSNHILDVSNPAVSAALAQNAIAYCKNYGFVGIWFDDVVRYPLGLLNALPAGWDATKWHTEIVAHSARVGDAVKAAGFDVCLNANAFTPGDNGSNDGSLEATFWTELAPHVTDLCAEYWMQSPGNTSQVYLAGGTDWIHQFNGWRYLHKLCQNLNIGFMPIQYGAVDSPELLYGRAAFLADYDGGRSALVSEAAPGKWSKAMGAATTPPPAATATTLSRSFVNGSISLNANTGTASIS